MLNKLPSQCHNNNIACFLLCRLIITDNQPQDRNWTWQGFHTQKLPPWSSKSSNITREASGTLLYNFVLKSVLFPPVLGKQFREPEAVSSNCPDRLLSQRGLRGERSSSHTPAAAVGEQVADWIMDKMQVRYALFVRLTRVQREVKCAQQSGRY